MGRGRDLNALEKSKILRLLRKGVANVEIAKEIGRHPRTISRFIASDQTGRKPRCSLSRTILTQRQTTNLKREMVKNPMSSSGDIFTAAGMPSIPRSTRCRILRGIGKVKKAQITPPVTKRHQERRLEWARKYMKTALDR